MFRNYISTTRTLDLLPVRFLIVRLYALFSDIFLSRMQNHPAFDADPNALSFRIDNVKLPGNFRFSIMIEEGYFGGYFFFQLQHGKSDDYMTWKTSGDTCREFNFQIIVDLDPETISWILKESTLEYSSSKWEQTPLGFIPGVDDIETVAHMAAVSATEELRASIEDPDETHPMSFELDSGAYMDKLYEENELAQTINF